MEAEKARAEAQMEDVTMGRRVKQLAMQINLRLSLLAIHLAVGPPSVLRRAADTDATVFTTTSQVDAVAAATSAALPLPSGTVASVEGAGGGAQPAMLDAALMHLARDGVVKLGHGWGFGRLLRKEGIAAWVSAKLDEVAQNVKRGGHVHYGGVVPGIAPLAEAVHASLGKLATAYLGDDAKFDRYLTFRLPAFVDLSAYPAGLYHHDRCGHRLKAYLLLTRVREGTHPLRVALGSHRTLFLAHNMLRTSRFSDAYVESAWRVGSVTGEVGEGFIFDTNAVHKAGGIGPNASTGHRDVLMFEFNARNKSARMRQFDRSLPCGNIQGPTGLSTQP